MKICIIVYSKSGNTQSVAELIKEKLILSKHDVNMERLSASNENAANLNDIVLNPMPELEGYDLVIFGSPVNGFALSLVMKAYLSRIGSLNAVNTVLFLTQFFPFKKLGGVQAMQQFNNLCAAKGSNVLQTGIINWSSPKRKTQISQLINTISSIKI